MGGEGRDVQRSIVAGLLPGWRVVGERAKAVV